MANNKTKPKIKSLSTQRIRPPYIEWNERGEITHVSESFALKCGFEILDEFKNTHKTLEKLFAFPSFEQIKEILNQDKGSDIQAIAIIQSSGQVIKLVLDTEIEIKVENNSKKYSIVVKVESHDFYKEMADDAPIGMFTSTFDGKFLGVNQTLVDIYGYSSKEEMLNLKDISLEIYAFPEVRNKLLEKLSENKKIQNYKFIGKKNNDGRRLLISKNVNAVSLGTNLMYCQGYVKDVSSMGNEDSPLPSFRCDTKGNIFYANKAMYEWLQYTEEEIYKLKTKELYFDPEQAKEWRQVLYEQKTLLKSPRKFKRKDGKPVDIYVDVYLREENGNPLFIEGCLCYDKEGVIKLPWTEKLKSYLSNAEYEKSIVHVDNIKNDLKIVSLSTEEIEILARTIKNIIDDEDKNHNLDNKSNIGKTIDPENYHLIDGNKSNLPDEDDLAASFFTEKRYDLSEKLKLSIWHVLFYCLSREKLLKNALSISQVSELLNISHDEVREKVEKKEILGINLDNGGEFLFPMFQFDIRAEGGIIGEISTILKNLHMSDLAKLDWLTRPNSMLKNLTPIDILKNGTPEDKLLTQREAFARGYC
jgi:PAS domain S-box-containing protein